MLRMTRCIKLTTFFALAVLLAAPLYAAPATGGVAEVLLGTTRVDWVPNNTMVSFSLVVSGPDGVVERTFESGETPTFDLAAIAGNIDGSYSWQLTATPELSGESRRLMAEARAQGTTFTPQDLPPRDQLVQSGHFRVVGGAVVQPDVGPEPRFGGDEHAVATGAASFIAEEQTFDQDVQIQGSLCVGFDCGTSESYGFDTVRLKENNLRIKFQDTSSSASFPTVDWQLTANDTSNGGADRFSIEDISNGRNPFTIEANSPNDTLYVDNTGRVGIGTRTPVLQIHTTDGNSPGLRLEQDGSAGFTAQTWDIAGNEANFFVRDATNGSKLPFKIIPNAPTNSLYVASSGDIGLGTASPDATLHARGTDGSTVLHVEEASGTEAQRNMVRLTNNGPVGLVFEDTTNNTWDISAQDNGFVINRGGSGVNELRIDNAGNLHVGGTQMNVPDYVFESDYELMPLSELAAFLESNKHLPNVPNARQINTQGMNLSAFPLRLLEKIEELTLYVLSQEQSLKSLQAENQELQQRLEALENDLP